MNKPYRAAQMTYTLPGCCSYTYTVTQAKYRNIFFFKSAKYLMEIPIFVNDMELRDSAISMIWRERAWNGKGRCEGGLNEFFGENWGWIEFSNAITRSRSRNKSAGLSAQAGNSRPEGK
jgi:hypothetical protein